MSNIVISLALLSSFLIIQGAFGDITCEQLNKEECAFAVSSTGKRCVLEKYVRRSGMEAYKCTTSEIEADKLKDLVESNHCIEACGLDRDTLGISSDSLLESRFTQKLCSPQCYQRCPNVVDLYFNLAAGEGVYLPKLCETQGENPRRGMSEIKSSGIVAPGPVSSIHGANFLGAPVGSVFAEMGAPVGSPTSSLQESGAPVGSPIYIDSPPSPISIAPASSPIYIYAPASSPIYTDAPASSPIYIDAPASSPTSIAAPAFPPF